MEKNNRAGTIADAGLFVIVTVPLALMLLVSSVCSGWNEGTMSGTCSLPVLTPLYDTLSTVMLMMAFGGFIFVGPVLLVFAIISIVSKIRKYYQGYRPKSVFAICREIIAIIPIAFLAYTISIVFGIL